MQLEWSFLFRERFYTPTGPLKHVNFFSKKRAWKMTLKILPGSCQFFADSLLHFLYISHLLVLLSPIKHNSWVPISTHLSAPPAFSANGLSNFSVLSVNQETLKIDETICGEGGRCAGNARRREVCWGTRYLRSGATLNRQEKHKKVGAIEGEKEGPWQQLWHTLG